MSFFNRHPALSWSDLQKRPLPPVENLGAGSHWENVGWFHKGGFLDDGMMWTGARHREDAFLREYRARGGSPSRQVEALVYRLSEKPLSILLHTVGQPQSDPFFVSDDDLGGGDWWGNSGGREATNDEIYLVVDCIEAIALSFAGFLPNGPSLWDRPDDATIRRAASRLKRVIVKSFELERAREITVRMRFLAQQEDDRRQRVAAAEALALRQAQRAQDLIRQNREALTMQRKAAVELPHKLALEMRIITDRVSDSMPTLIKLEELAAKAFSRHAYSSFWSNMENLYQGLGELRADLDKVASIAEQVKRQLAFLATEAWFQGPPPSITLPDVICHSSKLAGLISGAENLLGKAETDINYALIWEQRRTTAAIVRGFGSMEQAFLEMSAVVAVSLSEAIDGIREAESLR